MLWSVPLLPLLAAPLIYLGGLRVGRAAVTLGAALVVLATLMLAALAAMNGWSGSYRWSETLRLSLQWSTAGLIFAVMVPLIALPIMVYAGYHEGDSRTRLLALLTAFVGAMQLLVLASDLLTLLIAWELVGFCSWALISHRWDEEAVPREAARSFLVTRFGDLGLYIAAAALFAGSGGFDYANLAALDGNFQHVAATGIIMAAAAKSAQLPFSSWLFAAMAGPVPASALLHSATMVAAGIFLLARLQPELADVAWFMPVIVLIGLTTALAGGVVAIFQGHAKKLLAASTSAQYGLMWVAVGTGFPGVALLHFATHGVLKAGLFLSSGLAERRTGSYALADMRLGLQMPGAAIVTLILSLALAGIVPLGAAWSKEQIVSAANEHGLWLALMVSLAGALSALYATRFQCLAYGRSRRRQEARTPHRSGSTGVEFGALVVLGLGTLGSSLLWWPPIHEAFAEPLGISLPPGHYWLPALSLSVVLLGVAGGIAMTRGGRADRASRWQTVASDWFRLPALTEGIATGVTALSSGLARFDDTVVDAGLRRTARSTQWFSNLNATRSERLSERLPQGVSRLADWSGQWARQAQTGQVHHYYTGITGGLAIIVVVLVTGAFF